MAKQIQDTRTSSRGAASVEAVVALPVFVILFIGVFSVRDLTGAKLGADEEARRCAWEYSVNGCEAIPEGCDGVVRKNPLGPTNPDVATAWETGKNDIKGGRFQKAIIDMLTSTVLDPLTKAFTQTLESSKLVERDRPNVFGGGKSQVMGNYHLACNLKSKDEDTIVNEVWDYLVP